MNGCQEFQALLDLFVDGELAPDEMARVQEHLDACPDCRSYVDGALAIRAAFPSIEDTVVPEGFADGVMERIRAGTPEKTVFVNFRRRWMGAAAALAACCAIAVLLRTGPVGMSGGMGAEAAVEKERSAGQSEAAFDTETAEQEDVAADAYGLDGGGTPIENGLDGSGSLEKDALDGSGALEKDELSGGGAPEENGEIHYTMEAASKEAESGTDAPAMQSMENTPQIRSAPAEGAGENADAGLDAPSCPEEAASASGERINEDAREDKALMGSPPSVAPANLPTPAVTSKAAGPDLILSEEEAGDLLDAFTPAEDNGSERTYLLTREEFAGLQEKLPVEFEPEEGMEILTIVVTAA